MLIYELIICADFQRLTKIKFELCNISANRIQY